VESRDIITEVCGKRLWLILAVSGDAEETGESPIKSGRLHAEAVSSCAPGNLLRTRGDPRASC
jgi:hypothetical protein